MAKITMRQTLLALLESRGPMTVEEMAEASGRNRHRIQSTCREMHEDKRIHIGGHQQSGQGWRVRIWHFGPGVDVPVPAREWQRKNTPTTLQLVERALADGPASAAQITDKVHRARASVNQALAWLRRAEFIHVSGSQPTGKFASNSEWIYSLGAAPLKGVVGVKKVVVVPHVLSNTCRDAENV